MAKCQEIWSEEKTTQLKELYPIRTMDELLKIFPKLTSKQITRKARKLKLKKTRETYLKIYKIPLNKNLYPWTIEDEELLKKCYLEEGGVKKAYKLLSHKTISAIRQKAFSLGLKNKVYYKNENFFESPNTMNCSIAGAISSDGHLEAKQRKNCISYNISIYQKSTDDEWLEQMLKATESNYKILRRTRKQHKILKNTCFSPANTQSVLIFSKAEKWVKDINKNWGIPIGHKSYTVPAPPNLGSLDNKLAYISGLICGDGSIVVSSSKKSRGIRIILLGTKPLLDWCKETIEEFLGKRLKNKVLKEHPNRELASSKSNLHLLMYSGYAAFMLFQKLYSLNTIKLNRKWNNSAIWDFVNKIKTSPNLYDRARQQFENLPDLFVTNCYLSGYAGTP